MIACPKCARSWEPPCEQTRCIERHGECIVCRFLPRGITNAKGSASGTKKELDALSHGTTQETKE